jgi:hypothetical protein
MYASADQDASSLFVRWKWSKPMTKLEKAVTKAASEMSREARAELAHRLLAELNDDEQKTIDAAWIAEIRRRMRETNAGEQLLDGEEVMRQARALVKK